jgi:DNA processing protein
VLSEYPPGHGAHRGTFPRRNRILAGLARGVLVVEAGRRSGTLITCEWALAYDRPVWAVPGPWSAHQSEGCHRLIRDGAQLADSPESLLRDLGVEAEAAAPLETMASALEAELLRILRRGPRLADALVSEVTAARGAVLVALQRLVAAGRIEPLPGGSYVVRGRRRPPA